MLTSSRTHGLALCFLILVAPLNMYSSSTNAAINPQLLRFDSATVIAEAAIIGDAYALNSNKLLYTEFHSFSDKGDQHRVSYRTANDQPLADKIIVYQQNPAAPEFHQQNHHTQTEISVNWQDDTLRIRSMPDGFDKLVNPAADLPVVIDAGFNMFIRQHWDALINGDSKVFNFAFAKRGSMIHMRISRTACDLPAASDRRDNSDEPNKASSNTDSICLVLQPDSWIFKMLAPPTKLTYRPDKILLRYRGLSNIDTETGDNQLVDIRYRLP